MEKIRLILRGGLDGATLATAPTDFGLVTGWTQGTLSTSPVGILPASLWGKVPAGDPYLAHINVLTDQPLGPGDFFELQSGAPIQPRVQYSPGPGNSRLVLVRPTDRLRFVVAPQVLVVIELLIESIGGVNELGTRLTAWSERSQSTGGVRSVRLGFPAALPAWQGLLHVIHDSANADVITLPTRSLVPLDAVLTFSRKGVGVPTLAAAAGDTIVHGLVNQQVNRAVIVYNNGEEWALVGT